MAKRTKNQSSKHCPEESKRLLRILCLKFSSRIKHCFHSFKSGLKHQSFSSQALLLYFPSSQKRVEVLKISLRLQSAQWPELWVCNGPKAVATGTDQCTEGVEDLGARLDE